MKGAKVYVEGKLTTNEYTDREGIKRYSTEIHLTPYDGRLTFLDNKRDADEPRAPRRNPASTGGSTGADLDDDVPLGPCWQ